MGVRWTGTPGQGRQPVARVLAAVRGGAPAGPTSTVSRSGWKLSSLGAEVPGQPLINMVDGNRGTRWSSGAGQSVGMSVTVDLGSPQTFSEIVMDAGYSIGDFLRR